MSVHPTHRTRISFDASTYDEICDLCGATDGIGTWGRLPYTCPATEAERQAYDEKAAMSRAAYEKQMAEQGRPLTVPVVEKQTDPKEVIERLKKRLENAKLVIPIPNYYVMNQRDYDLVHIIAQGLYDAGTQIPEGRSVAEWRFFLTGLVKNHIVSKPEPSSSTYTPPANAEHFRDVWAGMIEEHKLPPLDSDIFVRVFREFVQYYGHTHQDRETIKGFILDDHYE